MDGNLELSQIPKLQFKDREHSYLFWEGEVIL